MKAMEEIDYKEIFVEAAKEYDKNRKPIHISKNFIKVLNEININRRKGKLQNN